MKLVETFNMFHKKSTRARKWKWRKTWIFPFLFVGMLKQRGTRKLSFSVFALSPALRLAVLLLQLQPHLSLPPSSSTSTTFTVGESSPATLKPIPFKTYLHFSHCHWISKIFFNCNLKYFPNFWLQCTCLQFNSIKIQIGFCCLNSFTRLRIFSFFFHLHSILLG